MIFPKPTSYYEKGFKRSSALERATAPFRVRNTLTGLGLIAFCGTVYAYSIMAVRQDDFSDIKLPSHVTDHQTNAESSAPSASS
ncbi:cytochrome c oxidase assembly factor 3, fungi type [Entomortierella parvispora]|uniref:Cytochrome c oxidase assembly factor 3 n=1 Tax=Entomortierella parvispora TaxID=205924 RepID=A0A9P3H889_9FUNG|nr:cytochrome c oxidase assembly factor 3, fungi type [Entomortierella parvispora]